MGNIKSVLRKFKNFRFFDKNWPKKIFGEKKSEHVAQLNGVPSINAKTLAFPRTQKYDLCALKKSKTDIFIANIATKKWTAENLEYGRS